MEVTRSKVVGEKLVIPISETPIFVTAGARHKK